MSTAPAIIPHIVEQHLEEAAFLWTQRCLAVKAPHYTLDDLCQLDERVEAHVDGLRVAGDAGWEMCEAALEEDDDPGLVFAASVIAYESQDGERIDKVVKAASRSLDDFRAAVSALGWLRDEHFAALRDSFLGANSIHYQRLAIAGCGVRRDDPGDALAKAAQSRDLFLRARALKAAGDLKRQDLMPALRDNLKQENHTCRFAAARAMLLMGDLGALDTIREFAFSRSAFRQPAIQIALRCVNLATAQDWLKALSRSPDQRRDALIGMGMVGDPAFVPTLIKGMDAPELARAAGEALSMITGIDLADANLNNGWPDDFESGPNDDPEDERVEPDVDEDLPWPNANTISEWWATIGNEFDKGARYLCGEQVTIENCTRVLEKGLQRQRKAAALELALMQLTRTSFSVEAPSPRQRCSLKSWNTE